MKHHAQPATAPAGQNSEPAPFQRGKMDWRSQCPTLDRAGRQCALCTNHPRPCEFHPEEWEFWGTPGEKSLDIGPKGGGVAVCQIVTTDGQGRFDEATARRSVRNGRLILQAPAMLAALMLNTDGEHPADERGPCLCSQCEFVRAKEAILRALTTD